MAISPIWANELRPKAIDYVYCLRNPLEDYDIFYVGRTYSPNERLLAHISESRETSSSLYRNKQKAKIIRAILTAGHKPFMWCIDKTKIWCSFDEYLARHKEIYWIKRYLEIGWNLVNIKDKNCYMLNTTHEMMKRKIEIGQAVSTHNFYYGKDSNGDDIYDIQRILRMGYKIPDFLHPPEKEERITYDCVYNDIPIYELQ